MAFGGAAELDAAAGGWARQSDQAEIANDPYAGRGKTMADGDRWLRVANRSRAENDRLTRRSVWCCAT